MNETVKLILLAVVVCVAAVLLWRLISYIRRRDILYVIDHMDGLEFEDYLIELFGKKGMDVWPTQATRDFGADLIIRTESEVLVIQAKRYQEKVGLEAVQQVAAAVPYYKGTRGIVITNNYYTEGAYELAGPNRVQLLDRDDLKEIIEGGDIPLFLS